jgi:hypothetical protein
MSDRTSRGDRKYARFTFDEAADYRGNRQYISIGNPSAPTTAPR